MQIFTSNVLRNPVNETADASKDRVIISAAHRIAPTNCTAQHPFAAFLAYERAATVTLATTSLIGYSTSGTYHAPLINWYQAGVFLMALAVWDNWEHRLLQCVSCWSATNSSSPACWKCLVQRCKYLYWRDQLSTRRGQGGDRVGAGANKERPCSNPPDHPLCEGLLLLTLPPCPPPPLPVLHYSICVHEFMLRPFFLQKNHWPPHPHFAPFCWRGNWENNIILSKPFSVATTTYVVGLCRSALFIFHFMIWGHTYFNSTDISNSLSKNDYSQGPCETENNM